MTVFAMVFVQDFTLAIGLRLTPSSKKKKENGKQRKGSGK
jgi:hypothetical protein